MRGKPSPERRCILTPEIVRVARQYALDPRKVKGQQEYRCCCPFHQPDDADQSLSFCRDKFGWFFKCWKCGVGGRDDRDWLKHWRFLERKEVTDGKHAAK